MTEYDIEYINAILAFQMNKGKAIYSDIATYEDYEYSPDICEFYLAYPLLDGIEKCVAKKEAIIISASGDYDCTYY
jgi:hypothetical protein